MTTSRSTRIWATVTFGLGMTLAAASPAAADPAGPKVSTAGSTYTLTVLSHETKSDMGSAGPTAMPKPGDKFGFADDLSQGGVKVGSDAVQCTAVSGAKSSCAATTTFDNGTLVLKGTTPMSMAEEMEFDVPIVSGTGAYDGAAGTMHLATVKGTHGADANLTFIYTTASSLAKAPSATAAGTKTVAKAGSASQVSKVPSGGAESGGGSTAGIEHGWMLGLGAVAAAAGMGTLAFGRRGR